MNVKDFISQLKSLKPGKRVEFLKQHLQDEFWLDVVKNKSYALQIFRFCCASSDINTCVGVFDILVQKGCFMRIIQKFDETRVIDNNILSILKICPDLLGNWFSGPLKFKTPNVFFTFLYKCSKYSGNLNLVGNIEQFLKFDNIKSVEFLHLLQNALMHFYKYNKQTYNYILKLINEANVDVFKSFNLTHRVTGDIAVFIQNMPELFIILKPPFIFDDVVQFINMAWDIWMTYTYRDGDDTRIFKYIDDHIDMIQFTSTSTTSIAFDSSIVIYYLGCLLNHKLLHIYELLIKLIGKNTKYLDEVYTHTQSDITYHCKQIHKDLESTFYNQLTDDNITADDIKDLFDI